jgi:tetratricopeptide (TPR) repeat protein
VRITSANPQKRAVSPATNSSSPPPSVATTPPSPVSQPLSEQELLASKGDYDGAITLLNKALALNPKDAQAFYQRAWCYSAKNAWDNVIADADKALALGHPYPGYVYTLRGQGRLGKLDFKGCIEDATQAIAIVPKSAMAYTLRAEATVRSGKWENVLEDCTTAIALLPDSVDGYMFRGYYYAHLGAMEAAEADWKKAIVLNPGNESVIKANRKIFEPKKKSSKKR